jgi:hypothetical protein
MSRSRRRPLEWTLPLVALAVTMTLLAAPARPRAPRSVVSVHAMVSTHRTASITASTSQLSPVLTDATSVNTPHWACIGWNESRNVYTQPGGGRWQFEGTTWYSVTGLSSRPEESSASVQNAAALSLYQYDLKVWGNGFHAWSTRFVCRLG